MTIEHKALRDLGTKVLPDDAAGDTYTYESMISVFNNRDHAGDVVKPGAFTKSLDRWRETGDPVPVYYAHRMDDPMMCIGKMVDVAEVMPGDPRLEGMGEVARKNGGLWARIELDAENNPVAKQTWSMLKNRLMRQASFSYEVKDGEYVQPAEGKADGDSEPAYYSLNELDLFEGGPCPLGCNDATDTAGIKSRQEALKKAAENVVSSESKDSSVDNPEASNGNGEVKRDSKDLSLEMRKTLKLTVDAVLASVSTIDEEETDNE
jgi:HK97 family phage prohead protease